MNCDQILPMLDSDDTHDCVVAIATIDAEIKRLKSDREVAEQTIRERIPEGGSESFDDGYGVSVGRTAVTHSVDSKLLKENYPAIYEECQKETTRKGSIRISGAKRSEVR